MDDLLSRLTKFIPHGICRKLGLIKAVRLTVGSKDWITGSYLQFWRGGPEYLRILSEIGPLIHPQKVYLHIFVPRPWLWNLSQRCLSLLKEQASGKLSLLWYRHPHHLVIADGTMKVIIKKIFHLPPPYNRFLKLKKAHQVHIPHSINRTHTSISRSEQPQGPCKSWSKREATGFLAWLLISLQIFLCSWLFHP